MNISIIAKTVGIIVAKVAKIGVTQTAIQNLQNTNRNDLKEIGEGNYEVRRKKLKVLEKGEKLEREPRTKEDYKEGAKKAGSGALKIMKVGAQSQVLYSLNEMNRDEMKSIDGQVKRGYKYNVAPKLQSIKKIKVNRD